MNVRLGRIGVFVVGAPLLAAGIYAAAVRGLADARHISARLALAEFQPAKGAPRTPPPEVIAAVLASTREASALDPSNPYFVEQAARLLELRALGLPQGDPAMRDGLRQSLAQYRQAASMRPGSPYVWASIAMLKLRLGDMDIEFYGALERAGRLGPWEPQVQIAMVDIGLAAWKWLSDPAREWVLGALDRALLRQAAEVQRVASVRGNLPLVCAQAGNGLPRLAAWCVRK